MPPYSGRYLGGLHPQDRRQTLAWVDRYAVPAGRLEGIITMQCGPVRHQIECAASSKATPILKLVVHGSHHPAPENDDTPIHQVFRALVDDTPRTAGICRDVVDALDRGRNCLVLTQWAEHVSLLCEQLRLLGRDPLDR